MPDNTPSVKQGLSNHAKISYVKSGVRIAGFIFLPINLLAAGVILVVAECVSIVEEFYE